MGQKKKIEMTPKKWMLITVFSFCIMAISIKEMSNEINSFQVIFYRSFIGFIIILFFFSKKLPRPTLSIIKEHLFRNIFHLVGQYGWILGIIYLSLAEVTAIEFSVPIWIILIASTFLKEKLTKTNIISIILGFLGVIFIIQPNIEIINIKSIIVLLSAISYAITHISTKRLTINYSSLDIVFMMCFIQFPIAFCFTLSDWQLPNTNDLFWLIIIGVFATTAHFTMAEAMKNSDISSIIPLDYLRLPILIIIGVFLYQETFIIYHIIGGTLILIGNWINFSKKL